MMTSFSSITPHSRTFKGLTSLLWHNILLTLISLHKKQSNWWYSNKLSNKGGSKITWLVQDTMQKVRKRIKMKKWLLVAKSKGKKWSIVTVITQASKEWVILKVQRQETNRTQEIHKISLDRWTCNHNLLLSINSLHLNSRRKFKS